MAKKLSTSFDLTDTTRPILDELRFAGWDIKEVVNAGIVMFSQANKTQKTFFRMAAYGIDDVRCQNAEDIFRKWIVKVVADAQSHAKGKKRPQQAKSSKSG